MYIYTPLKDETDPMAAFNDQQCSDLKPQISPDFISHHTSCSNTTSKSLEPYFHRFHNAKRS